MSLTPSPYVCPRWLRNPHAQSLLASSPLRSARGRVRLRQARAQHRPMLLTLRSNVRLQGIASLPMHTTPRALVLLLHGWMYGWVDVWSFFITLFPLTFFVVIYVYLFTKQLEEKQRAESLL